MRYTDIVALLGIDVLEKVTVFVKEPFDEVY